MKNFDNQLTRSLEYEEMMAVMQASQILAKAFKKGIWTVSIRPNLQEPSDAYGVAFAFDLKQDGWK